MNASELTIPHGGIYLIIDPAMEEAILLQKLSVIINKGISAVQIWDHFPNEKNVKQLILNIQAICEPHQVPLLMNNRWEYLQDIKLAGVHFDDPPDSLPDIQKKINRKFIVGLTCGNDLRKVEWALSNDIDYISFCSMFPSPSAGVCEIVTHETVQKARMMFKKPIFLAGGIRPNNLMALSDLDFDGIAVISGLMYADEPDKVLIDYLKNLKKIKDENRNH
ncbi:MAG: thiamine phosphate synthase [Thermoflavifilum sp.]|nr:thiamine phosphate synthase [Thermoflavifilum sp.]